MLIDNSTFSLYHFCPLAVREKVIGDPEPIEKISDDGPRSFGTRMHQLLEEHYARMRGKPIPDYPPAADEAIEAEAQATFAAYLGHYPVEDFEVVETERTHTVPLPCLCDDLNCAHHLDPETEFGQHSYALKIDLVLRKPDGLWIMDHKTQRRGGQGNHPKSWAARTQASLYLWAARQIYGETPAGFILNLITRQSEKGRVSPDFFRDVTIERTPAQMEEAVQQLVYVADRIEEHQRTGFWPTDRNRCHDGWRECDFYPLHTIGRTDANLKLYRPAERYLDI